MGGSLGIEKVRFSRSQAHSRTILAKILPPPPLLMQQKKCVGWLIFSFEETTTSIVIVVLYLTSMLFIYSSIHNQANINIDCFLCVVYWKVCCLALKLQIGKMKHHINNCSLWNLYNDAILMKNIHTTNSCTILFLKMFIMLISCHVLSIFITIKEVYILCQNSNVKTHFLLVGTKRIIKHNILWDFVVCSL